MLPLLADVILWPPHQWSVAGLAIAIVIVAAIVALVYVALNKFGVAIPDWVIQVFWIIIVAFVIIMAIRLVAAM